MLGVAPAGAPPRPANLKGTMLGVAPAGSAAAPAAPAIPARPANLKGTMLGVAPAAPALGKPPPMPVRRAPAGPAAAPPAASAGTGAFSDLDLPTVGRAPGAPRPPQTSDVDLPAALAPAPFDDLPAPVAPKAFDDLPARVGPRAFDDLPMAAAPRSVSGGPAASSPFDLYLDLPSPSPGGRAQASARPASSAIELDLPTVGGARGSDLPAVSGRNQSGAALPSPVAQRAASGAGLPAVQTRGFGEVELPSLSAGLPEVSRSALPAVSEVELPSLGARAPSGGFEFGDDLPLPGGNLPSLGGVGLPSRAQSSAGLPVFSAAGLPSPGGSNPARPGSVAPSAMPSLPPDFGLDPVSPGAQASRGAGTDFGDLELPIGDAPNLAGRASGAQGTFGAPPAFRGDGEEADLFGQAPIPGRGEPAAARPRAPVDAAVVRQSGGGTAYGEVNLGDEAEVGGELPIEAGVARQPARRDEDMEFGAIPQEDQPKKPSLGPQHATVGGARALEGLLPRKRGLGLKIYASLFVLLVGGAALALAPSLGPFGYYFVIDHVKAGEYAALVTSTVKNADGALANDTYPDAQRAIAAAENAHQSARRVRELPAFEAFVAYAEELRFGPDSAAHARATVLLDELADHPETRYLPLARAARAAADGQATQAKQLFDALAPDPSNLGQAFLGGEIALRASDPKAALALWQQLAAAHKSPRAAFGLARARYATGDSKAAEAAARDALSQNPSHVAARILLARIDSASKNGEADALSLLASVLKDAKIASANELVSAQTLLGDIHLARSRMTQAEAAYNEALKINPKAARALDGLGEALYRAGRYSEAQARFEASSQADPNDLPAKIGVAKSKLGLERVEDASAMLKKLHDSFPKSVPAAYWYGRALEASGNRALAETVYRTTLKTPSDDPQIVDTYIALALLQSQQGQNDDAQQTLGEARQKLPDLPAIHKALGDVALSQGHYSDATNEFKQALALDSEDLSARFKLGVAQRRDSKFDDASKAFDDVASVDKEYPGLALERGLLFEASGHTDEALR
jgi:cytochrome c-type biogenesis protein CcmH/NrfG